MTDVTRPGKAEMLEAVVDGRPVLNRVLYEALVRHFGDVEVAKQGTPLLGGGYIAEAGTTKFRADESGEYYKVNCPFCQQHEDHDEKQRLWINHRWGVGLDEDHPAFKLKPGDRFWWAAICYHHNCMANPENVQQLRTWAYGGLGRELHRTEIKIEASTKPISLGVVEMPGLCVRVDQLSEHHCAVRYLRSRGFDPKQLGEQYRVAYCEEAPPQYPLVNARIVLPIYMNGQMVGWQTRPPYEADWKAARTPKYYICPGTNKSLMLYGFDIAKSSPYCIITEGVTDVWALGDNAVATFGKVLSFSQANLIYKNWKAAVIAYDGDAHTEAFSARIMLSKMPVVPMELPDGLDPATIDKTLFVDLMLESADKVGVDLFNL